MQVASRSWGQNEALGLTMAGKSANNQSEYGIKSIHPLEHSYEMETPVLATP